MHLDTVDPGVYMPNPSKIYARLLQITDFGNDIFKLDFEVPRRYTRFLPGQFLHITLDEVNESEGYWPESRVFSICSSPREDGISIVYSVKGSYTQRMKHELEEEQSYWLKLPYGDFIIDSLAVDFERIVLVAGGTGISPFIPFLRAQNKLRYDIDMYYGFRDKKLLIFENELKNAANTIPNFHLEYFCENNGQMENGIKISKGRLSIDTIWEKKYTNNTGFFLSGPPDMLAYFEKSLTSKGVPSTSVFIDAWE